ncbi:MAG: hypothetical protein QXI71_01650 [Candidatus Bathyarchaeia archaeon]|nr:hypothetical protein [Candidatus Bathyarchaeota archaeon]
MSAEGNSSLKKKIEGEFPEQTMDVSNLVRTLVKSFLRSDSNYGAITDIKTDMNYIYDLVVRFIQVENMDIYALKLEDRILLSRTGPNFDELYSVIKARSTLQIKKDMIEIWDDATNKILHLIIVPVKKHFPIEYANTREKARIIEKISLMTWTPASP